MHQLSPLSCHGPAIAYDPGTTVLSLFSKQVLQGPEAIAIADGEEKLSYAELDELSEGMAMYLQSKYNVAAGDTIAVLMDRSLASVVSTLAVLKCGGVYLPVDTSYPVGRINYMLQDSGCALVICAEESYHAVLQNAHVEVFDLLKYTASEGLLLPLARDRNDASYDASLRGVRRTGLPRGTGGKQSAPNTRPAYIIYTSGSTGQPKGVLVSHAALADYVQTFIHTFQLGKNDALVHHSSISFDTAVEEIFVSLCSGMKLVVSREGGRNIEKLIGTMVQHNVTMISATPLLINELNKRAERLPGLRLVMSGGEELRTHFIDRLLPRTAVYNSYGPTESTVCVTWHHVQTLQDAPLIGRPISNRSIYVLDENLQPSPPGEIGEICIGGKGLAEGYVNAPELTARKFIENLFQPGEIIFRTGDLGRWNTDGVLEFHGRKDEQVKINGYRVELAEVENSLLGFEGIRDVKVLPRTNGQHSSLMAWYTADREIGSRQLHDFLKLALPAYMLPAAYTWVTAIPLLANGKTDRRQLLDISVKTTKFPQETGNPTEEKIRLLWEQVLQNTEIGLNDSFFESGGTSLAAMQLFDAMEREFPGIFTMAGLFNQVTIRAQAEFVLMKTEEKKEEDVGVREVEL